MTETHDLVTTFRRLEDLFAHVWMVRTFIKHSEEAEEDDDLMEVQRELYDAMHSLGPFSDASDAAGYIKQTRRKLKKLRDASQLFTEVQPEISNHTSFQMAERSLRTAITEIAKLVESQTNSATPSTETQP